MQEIIYTHLDTHTRRHTHTHTHIYIYIYIYIRMLRTKWKISAVDIDRYLFLVNLRKPTNMLITFNVVGIEYIKENDFIHFSCNILPRISILF